MRFLQVLKDLKKVWQYFSFFRQLLENPPPTVPYQPSKHELQQSKQQLERILLENILPFWYPKLLDPIVGGYHINHDLHGQWLGPANKILVPQARTVWFFSSLSRSRYGTKDHLEFARHGYEFLRNHMWDKEYGGFYWELDSTGRVPVNSDKHLYGQAFGISALSEYAKASGDASAFSLAQELFQLLETYAYDHQHGGYEEFFQHNWTPVSANRKGFRSVPPGIKTMNVHLHLMEAMTPLYILTRERLVQQRLVELILVQSNAVVRKPLSACTDQYHPNWTPLRGPQFDRVSYGHDLENVWLLGEACKAAEVSSAPLLDLFQVLFRYALQYGFDELHGGFYDSGPFHARADRLEKIWWVQAESLVCALYLYSLTGEEVYWSCFSRTLAWISQRQVDWEHGEWYTRILTTGEPVDAKTGPWKAPYHNGRAMLRCLELLASFPMLPLFAIPPAIKL